MPIFAKHQWRSIIFYRRLAPILWRCYRTKCAARRKRRSANKLWASRHEKESVEVIELLLEMKGFYLKLGQVLASKGDILPAPYCREMRRLFGDLPPESFETIRDTVEFELDIDNLDEVFESFDTHPIAVGTIAQVHRATLHGGSVVAVKVPKRDVERELLADISAMRRAAELCDVLGLELGFDSASILREYEEQVPLEFDFEREANVMREVGKSLVQGPPASVSALLRQDDGGATPWLNACVVPKTVPKLCTPGLIVMEWAPGLVMTDVLDWGDERGEMPSASECRTIVTALLQALGQQIFVRRCFNSDPHPGNIIWDRENGKVHLVDFGQSKELTKGQCEKIAWLVMALVGRDDRTVAEAVTDAGLVITSISDGKERKRRKVRKDRKGKGKGDRGKGGKGGERDERVAVGAPASVENTAACAYILFDTRMDIPQAHPGEELAKLQRTTAVAQFPEDLFMVMRVVTIVRGILGMMKIDVSAAQVWEPWARYALGLLPDAPGEDAENAMIRQTAQALGLSENPPPSTDAFQGILKWVDSSEPEKMPRSSTISGRTLSSEYDSWNSLERTQSQRVSFMSGVSDGEVEGERGMPKRLTKRAVEDTGYTFL